MEKTYEKWTNMRLYFYYATLLVLSIPAWQHNNGIKNYPYIFSLSLRQI